MADVIESGTLAKLARTCKATSEPALDTLWKTLLNPAHIFRLLPANACELIESQYVLTRPLGEADFSVFDKYAPRVRIVDFSYFTSHGMGCDLFSHLKSLRDPIFPRLLELKWHPSIKFHTVEAFHLITVGVPANKLELSIWDGNILCLDAPPSHGTSALLAISLALWIPDVLSLVFVLNREVYSNAQVLEGLQTLTKLQHISFNFLVGPDILAHLAELPHLLSLSLSNEDEDSVSGAKKIIHSRRSGTSLRGFSALEKFSIHNCEYPALCALLALIASGSLRAVTFNFDHFVRIDATLFQLIAGPDPAHSFERRANLRLHFRVPPARPH